jgi:hypothetical protein
MLPNQVYVSPSNPASVTVSGEPLSEFVIKYRQVLSSVTGKSILVFLFQIFHKKAQ